MLTGMQVLPWSMLLHACGAIAQRVCLRVRLFQRRQKLFQHGPDHMLICLAAPFPEYNLKMESQNAAGLAARWEAWKSGDDIRDEIVKV